jgi:ribosome-associated protein
MASVEVNQMLAAAAAACEDKKAEDIRILALDPAESGLADYFLICTGTNDRQTVAITDEIELRLKRDFATYPNSVEGRRQGEWILMDYVDFIVHVFLPEKRAFYGLERLRKSATTLSVDELNSEIKSAIKANRPATKKTAGKKAAAAVESAEPAVRRTAKKTPAKKTTAKKAAGKKVAPKKSAKRATTKLAARKTAGGTQE